MLQCAQNNAFLEFSLFKMLNSHVFKRMHSIAAKKPQKSIDYLFGPSIQAALKMQRRSLLKFITCLPELPLICSSARLPVQRISSGKLSALTEGRPNQGLVLQCGKLKFKKAIKIDATCDGDILVYQSLKEMEKLENNDNRKRQVWLALDHIQDPQNLGTLTFLS